MRTDVEITAASERAKLHALRQQIGRTLDEMLALLDRVGDGEKSEEELFSAERRPAARNVFRPS